MSNKKDKTKSTHNVDDWEKILDEVSKESQSKGSLKSEFNFDENEMYDSIAKDNRLKLIIQEEREHVVEFKYQGLNKLIKIEAPYQYLNLVMEEQANEFMNEVVSKEDDYED